MDITDLDATVQFLCQKGVAESTHKTYQCALRRFASFCSIIHPQELVKDQATMKTGHVNLQESCNRSVSHHGQSLS